MSDTKLISDLVAEQLMEDTGRNVYIMIDKRQVNTVNNPQGSAFSFGDHTTNTVTNYNSPELEDLTSNLLELLRAEEIDPSQKAELTDLIEAASQEANSPEPKKGLLRTFLSGSKGLMDTFVRSPELIEAYSKWATFIQSVI